MIARRRTRRCTRNGGDLDSGKILLGTDEEVLPRGCSDEEGEVVLGRDLLSGTKRERRRFSMTIILGCIYRFTFGNAVKRDWNVGRKHTDRDARAMRKGEVGCQLMTIEIR